MEVKKSIMLRIYFTFFIICLMGLAILVKIVSIQLKRNYWEPIQTNLTKSEQPILPARGNIFSSDGRILATSVPIYDLRLDTRSIVIPPENFNQVIDSLSHCLENLFKDKSWQDYKQQILTEIGRASCRERV